PDRPDRLRGLPRPAVGRRHGQAAGPAAAPPRGRRGGGPQPGRPGVPGQRPLPEAGGGGGAGVGEGGARDGGRRGGPRGGAGGRGHCAAGGEDGPARVGDVATGKPYGPPLAHQQAVVAVAFSADGRTLATGSNDRTARLWDVATGKPLSVPLRHGGPVSGLSFHPDGLRLATSGSGPVVHLWELPAPRAGTASEVRLRLQALA